AIATLGLNLQWGFTGIMNVGIVGFFGVGAYTAAFLTGPVYPGAFGGFGLHPLLGFLGAMLASAVVAAIVGIPTIRLKHDFLAIGTFGIAGKKPADIAGQLFEKHKIHTVAITWEAVDGVRVTPNVYTTTEELDKLVRAIKAMAA
ncbi:MAG TPA: hypothetical protein PK858_01805, partial [Saprospiraceae bacterium]|nr:hypothetical protein [Saprospiraceae bacterium]